MPVNVPLVSTAFVCDSFVYAGERLRRCARQAFCDERGEPLTSHEAGERLTRELELDKEMRMYHRRSENPRSGLFPMHPHVLK